MVLAIVIEKILNPSLKKELRTDFLTFFNYLGYSGKTSKTPPLKLTFSNLSKLNFAGCNHLNPPVE